MSVADVPTTELSDQQQRMVTALSTAAGQFPAYGVLIVLFDPGGPSEVFCGLCGPPERAIEAAEQFAARQRQALRQGMN